MKIYRDLWIASRIIDLKNWSYRSTFWYSAGFSDIIFLLCCLIFHSISSCEDPDWRNDVARSILNILKRIYILCSHKAEQEGRKKSGRKHYYLMKKYLNKSFYNCGISRHTSSRTNWIKVDLLQTFKNHRFFIIF